MLGQSVLASLAAFVAAAAALAFKGPLPGSNEYSLPSVPHKDHLPHENNTFDYVVVGGGTAGLTVATRLVEASYSVAVIEAGGYYEQDNGNFSIIPGFCSVWAGTDPTDFNPLVDWGIATEPQKAADDRRLHYPRGKTLGGSSGRNFMYYHRPTVGSLDEWAKEVEDGSYTFDKLLPFYKRSVHYTPPAFPFTNSTYAPDPEAWSPSGGPVQLSLGNFVDPYGSFMQPALESSGVKAINGLSSGKLIGSSYLPFTVDPVKFQRSSSEASYLRSVQDNPLMHVFHNTLAEKIHLNRQLQATGVKVSANNKTFTLHARKEIILSAGVFQSPQLLMLSGIGPKTTLDKFGIPRKLDLPGVGQNLQDHPFFGSAFRIKIPTVSASINNPALLQAAIEAYEQHAAGPLTIPTTGLVGWEKLPDHLRSNWSAETRDALAAFPEDWPEIEHVPANAYLGYQRNYQTEDPKDGYNYASLMTSMVAPLSRGQVTISSNKPQDLPLVDPNYFGHPADREVAIASLKRQREIWATLSQQFDLLIGEEALPGANVTSDDQIFDFIKQSVAPTWHAAGTCKMGKKERGGDDDGMSVVDPEGRVFGTKGLRVVDASVFPRLPPGHPQATVYAVAERIVEGIIRGR